MPLTEFIRPCQPAARYATAKTGEQIHQWNRKKLPEKRILMAGISDLNGSTQRADDIRKELYQYYAPAQFKNVVDLGNIISIDPEDQAEVTNLLIKEAAKVNCTLFLMADNSQHLNGLLTARPSDTPNNIAIVNSQIEQNKKDNPSELLNNNTIQRLFYLGIQSHYLNPALLKQKRPPGIYRLGQLRDDIKEFEPVFRQASKAIFDMNAVKTCDFPDNDTVTPNGLHAEEMCQLAWFAGNSDTMRIIAVTGASASKKYSPVSIAMIAQTLWYCLQGAVTRQHDDPYQTPEKFKQYFIENNKLPEELVIYKSKKSGKYWIRYGKNKIFIPCTKKDMDDILHHNVPERLWNEILLTNS